MKVDTENDDSYKQYRTILSVHVQLLAAYN